MQKRFWNKYILADKHLGLAKKLSATLLFCLLLFILCGCKQEQSEPDAEEAIPTSVADAALDNDSNDEQAGITNVPIIIEVTSEPEPEPATEPEPEPPVIALKINEILPTNNSTIRHNGGYYDAVEIINVSDGAIDISDYCLSDSKKHRTDYTLPGIELQPGEVAVVYCTGKYQQQSEDDLPFELSYFGEKIYLCDRSGKIIDKAEYPEMPADVSYSLNEDGDFVYCTSPTIGKPNQGGYRQIAPQPKLDPAAGFYDEGQKVRFTTEGEIHYTLDGSTPTSASPVWDGNDIIIERTCSIRAFTHMDGCLDSFGETFDFFINEGEFELGVMYVSLNPADFDTMNENYRNNRKYPANATLFTDKGRKFSIDCGISVFGCTSREYDKKSYQLSFTTKYGPSKLKYRMFDNLNIDSFNSLILRSGSQDNEGAIMRDEYVSSLALSEGLITDVLAQAYRPVNLFVNGQYWGLYYVREHIDEHMIASHYDCDPEEVTLLEQGLEVKCGKEAKEWQQMWNSLSNGPLSDENYEYISSIVDLQGVADYYIIQMWCTNHDLDNVRQFKIAGDKWRYVLYDLDLTLTADTTGGVKYAIGGLNTGLPKFNALVYRLLEKQEFKELFFERLVLLTSSIFSEEYAIAHLDEMEAMLDHDMQYHNCIRWNGKDSTGRMAYKDYKGWKKSVEYLRSLLKDRNDTIIEDYCNLKGLEIPATK